MGKVYCAGVLIAFLLVACLSAPGMGAWIGIKDSCPEIGNRTYSLENPLFIPMETVFSYRGIGVLIIDPKIGIEYNITDNLSSLSYVEGQEWYPFQLDRCQFNDCVVDLFYFEGGSPPDRTNNAALLDSYNLTAGKNATIGETYSVSFGKDNYLADVWEVSNPIDNNRDGYLVQIEPDRYTVMNMLINRTHFDWYNESLEVGGLA